MLRLCGYKVIRWNNNKAVKTRQPNNHITVTPYNLMTIKPHNPITVKPKNRKNMIKVENLSKSFRTEEVETIALDKVSFEVNDGEFVAIMGPSGCGKSTLLNILGLLDNPTSGMYWLDGQEVSLLKEKDRTGIRKGQIGFVFQS